MHQIHKQHTLFVDEHFTEVHSAASLAACQKSEDVGAGSLVAAGQCILANNADDWTEALGRRQRQKKCPNCV